MYDPNQARTHKGKNERQQMMRSLAKESGVDFWEHVDSEARLQRDGQRAVNCLRAIVEALLDKKEKPLHDWITEFVFCTNRVIQTIGGKAL